ncbi:hypothetical protein SUGI_0852630 [Cryptomeria japonica]|uniref:probable 2-oxoglutarate-dependent dioxygenase AOP1 n=1 Tax=Cryptomeria japonica TaxID=3369 RepID=UPI002414B23E|nr:probable 2-oxoglutarate-dependent dioxygenase AOP1 [Cryptomeria japonica]GLJ41186.1 hypothetical protein SUGI_0852630 [Cryptomeria japonica]
MISSLQSPLEDGLPVIDISHFPKEIEGDRLQYHPEVVKLGKCEEWGIFRLVNHGVPQDLRQKVLSVSQDLLSMPMELKDSVTTSSPGRSYSHTPGVPITFESFGLVDMPNPDSILELSRKIWPDEGNSNFCEAIGAFSLLLSDLAQRITKLVLVSLGLDAEAFYHSDFEKCTAWLKINGFSSQGKSIGEEGLIAHADRGWLTILHNDEEEGLEVLSKEGKWVNVKPSQNSLIVNLGISLKAWTNGRYRCAVHRVICKGWEKRLSVPLFYSFARDAHVLAPEVLVSEDNPRRYKPFTLNDLQSEELRKELEES